MANEELIDQYVGHEGCAVAIRDILVDQGWAPRFDVSQPYLLTNPDDARVMFTVGAWDTDGAYVFECSMYLQEPTWLVGSSFMVEELGRNQNVLTRILYHIYDWTLEYGIDRLSIVAGGAVYWGPRGFESQADSQVSALPEQWVSHSDGTWDVAREAAQERLGSDYA